jgi:uncharacterized protein YicC (UPF0701 family)
LASGASQIASLAPLEPELRVQIKTSNSLGHLDMTVEITPNHLQQEHVFRFEIDQSYIPSIVEQCRAIEKSFPIRGETARRGGLTSA